MILYFENTHMHMYNQLSFTWMQLWDMEEVVVEEATKAVVEVPMAAEVEEASMVVAVMDGVDVIAAIMLAKLWMQRKTVSYEFRFCNLKVILTNRFLII